MHRNRYFKHMCEWFYGESPCMRDNRMSSCNTIGLFSHFLGRNKRKVRQGDRQEAVKGRQTET